MGGLRKYLPITYFTMLVGALANAGFPPFAGFFSKDTIIEAIHASHTPGASIAYVAALLGVFVGALYSFRLVFFAFHGKERFNVPAAHVGQADHDAHDDHHHHGFAPGEKPHEASWVVWLPLILLAIPSVVIGAMLIEPMLYGGYFDGAIKVSETMRELKEEFHGVSNMILHGFLSLPFWFAFAGAVTAWYGYIIKPELPAVIRAKAHFFVNILEQKYGFDRFNDWFFASGARRLGAALWKFGDVTIIDGFFVNGTAKVIGWGSSVMRRLQSGFLYTYAFTMIIGVFGLLTMVFVKLVFPQWLIL